MYLLHGRMNMSPLAILVSLGMVAIFLLIEKVKEEQEKKRL
jgi:hypothetical protein